MFPVYTHNNLYFNYFAGLFLMSDIEMEERWARKNIFNNNVNEQYIADNYFDIWVSKFLEEYQQKQTVKKVFNLVGIKLPDQPRVPLEYIKRVHNDYKKIKQQDAIIAIEKFSVDYMVVNANYDQKTFLMIEKDNNVKKIVTINNYSIYEFVN